MPSLNFLATLRLLLLLRRDGRRFNLFRTLPKLLLEERTPHFAPASQLTYVYFTCELRI